MSQPTKERSITYVSVESVYPPTHVQLEADMYMAIVLVMTILAGVGVVALLTSDWVTKQCQNQSTLE